MLDVASPALGSTAISATLTAADTDLVRRVREGDATIGWTGDPTFEVTLAVPVDHLGRPLEDRTPIVEVWGMDLHGAPYVALRWPRLDVSLLRRLVEIDGRIADPMERIRRQNEAARRQREASAAEHRADVADRLHHALTKDLGHLMGGTRRLHSMHTSGG